MKNKTCAHGRGEQQLPNNDQLILLKDAIDELFMLDSVDEIKNEIFNWCHYKLTHQDLKDEKIEEAAQPVFLLHKLHELIDRVYPFYTGYDKRTEIELEKRLERAKKRL